VCVSLHAILVVSRRWCGDITCHIIRHMKCLIGRFCRQRLSIMQILPASIFQRDNTIGRRPYANSCFHLSFIVPRPLPAFGKPCVFCKAVPHCVHRARAAQAPMPMHNVRDCHVGGRVWPCLWRRQPVIAEQLSPVLANAIQKTNASLLPLPL